MDNVAAWYEKIREWFKNIGTNIKADPVIEHLKKLLEGPFGLFKAWIFQMIMTLLAPIMGPINKAKQTVENVKKFPDKIKKLINGIKKIFRIVKSIVKAAIKVLKPVAQLYLSFPSPTCWVAWGITLITVIIVLLSCLLGRFGGFAGEFVMDFDKMQELNQVEEDYTDLLNTGALKEAFYESIADTSFYQTFNLTDMDGGNVSFSASIVSGLASMITGEEYTAADIYASKKCDVNNSDCLYSHGNLLQIFTENGIVASQLDPRYQITDASKNPAKYLIQAESLGTYSDSLGMTTYFRDYWNREEQFQLSADFLYELNRWIYETDAYPTTEQIVYPEAFVQPVSFVDDYLRIQNDKTLDSYGDPYVYVTQRVTLDDILELGNEYYGQYQYEGLIKTMPSDIVYDYVVAGVNSYEIAQDSVSASQVNIGNPSDYATIKDTVDYGNGELFNTEVVMKAYWIVNPLFMDDHMGVDVTFADYCAQIDVQDEYNKSKLGTGTGYYYRTSTGSREEIKITTAAFIGPFMNPKEVVVGGKITIEFDLMINEYVTNGAKIRDDYTTKERTYVYRQYNPNIINSALLTFNGGYEFVNCVVDYNKSLEAEKDQYLYNGEGIYYDGHYYYYSGSSIKIKDIDFGGGSFTKADNFAIFPRVIEFSQNKDKTIYPGEIIVIGKNVSGLTGKAGKAFQYIGTSSTTLTASVVKGSNVEKVEKISHYNMFPTRHYQLTQLADEGGIITVNSRNLINKTYLKTKTVRPYYRNSDAYWTAFEDFVTEDKNRAAYVGFGTNLVGATIMGQCKVMKEEDESNFYKLHYCSGMDEDSCVLDEDDWVEKKCSVVKFVNQLYPGQDLVAKLSNLFSGDSAEFAELPMSAESIYLMLTLFEDYLISTGTEGVEWEYKYYSNSKHEALMTATEFAPSWSFFGIKIPDPTGLSTYFETTTHRYKDTFDAVVSLNESRAISTEYTPIGVISGTNTVYQYYECSNGHKNYGPYIRETYCSTCGCTIYLSDYNEPNVWGWRLNDDGTLTKVYGESSLEFPDYYNDWDVMSTNVLTQFDKFLEIAGQYNVYAKIGSYLFSTDYAENTYGAVNFAYKWTDVVHDVNGNFKEDEGENWTELTLKYDEAALSDFYTCLFLKATDVPVGDNEKGDADQYQDIRNDDYAWLEDDSTIVWRPAEDLTVENADGRTGVMVSCEVDGRGCGRVTSQKDPENYLALELKSVRDYGLGSVLSYLEARKVTFLSGIAVNENYNEKGVYAWIYSYYMNNETFKQVVAELGSNQKSYAEKQAKLAMQGFYSSGLLDEEIKTKLLICPNCNKELTISGSNRTCSKCKLKFNDEYILNDFVRSDALISAKEKDKNGNYIAFSLVSDHFYPSDLCAIADGLNALQGTGESIFKYKNPHNNIEYWFTVTYAKDVDDTNTDFDDNRKTYGFVVMVKEFADFDGDGDVDQTDKDKAEWKGTNINVVIPYLTQSGIANFFSSTVNPYNFNGKYTDANARSEANNQFFNPKGYYLVWFDYNTDNLDFWDQVGSLFSRKEMITQYDNQVAAAIRKVFGIYDTCELCLCADSEETEGSKKQLHLGQKPNDTSYDHSVLDANGDLICDICEADVCPCVCHALNVNFGDVSKVSSLTDGDAGIYTTVTAYNRFHETYKNAADDIDLLDMSRTSKVYMIEEAVTFLGNFLYSYDTSLVIAGDVYGDEKIVSDLVFADRGYILSNYIFAMPAITTYVQWSPYSAATQVYGLGSYPEGNGSNDGAVNYNDETAFLNQVYKDNPCLDLTRSDFIAEAKKSLNFLENVGVWLGEKLGLYNESNIDEKLYLIEENLAGNKIDTRYCASNYAINEVLIYEFEQDYIFFVGNYNTDLQDGRCSSPYDDTNGGRKPGINYLSCSENLVFSHYEKVWYSYKYTYTVDVCDETDPETNACIKSHPEDRTGTGWDYYLDPVYKWVHTWNYDLFSQATNEYIGTKSSGKISGTGIDTEHEAAKTRAENTGHHYKDNYYYEPTDLRFNQSKSYIEYTWYYSMGLTYNINKISKTDAEQYDNVVYFDTYDEVTRIYKDLVARGQTDTAKKIFIGMMVQDDTGRLNFAGTNDNAGDLIEDAVHYYTVNDGYYICRAVLKAATATEEAILCNKHITIEEYKKLKKNNEGCGEPGHTFGAISEVKAAYKLCPACNGKNDSFAKKCTNIVNGEECGANIKKVSVTYVIDESKLKLDTSQYKDWCFVRQPGKCNAAAFGDTEPHYTYYSTKLMSQNAGSFGEAFEFALKSAGNLFSSQIDIVTNLEQKYGLLLGENRLDNNGNLNNVEWWLKNNSLISKTTDGSRLPYYSTYVDIHGNLDDDSITNDNEFASIEQFEFSWKDIEEITASIVNVYSETTNSSGKPEYLEYTADGDIILGDDLPNPDAEWVELTKSDRVIKYNTNRIDLVSGTYKTYWNEEIDNRGISVSTNTGMEKAQIKNAKSNTCKVNFHWLTKDVALPGGKTYEMMGSAMNNLKYNEYYYSRTVYRKHYLSKDPMSLMVGIEVGNKVSYGTPIALETTIYGNYKQITPVQTSMFFNEEVYQNWRERMDPNVDPSTTKDQYLLSYRDNVSRYLYDYLTNFETYLPLSVKSDADLVNRAADAYRSIQANDQRNLSFVGAYSGTIKAKLGTTGWVTIIENYNITNPLTNAFMAAISPAVQGNKISDDVLAQYIAGLIETSAEYAPEWTIEYYNAIIEEENARIAASNAGKAESEREPLCSYIERSFDNYAAIEDQLYYSTTITDITNLECRQVKLYHEDGTSKYYNMLFLGSGAVFAYSQSNAASYTIGVGNIASGIYGFGSPTLTIANNKDERLDPDKAMEYVTTKFGKLLYKYGNVASATMAYFYGEAYWDEMIMVAATQGISTGPEWHNDDLDLIEEVIGRIEDKPGVNGDAGTLPVLLYDEEYIQKFYTAQVVDYALSFVPSADKRLYLIRNTTSSLGEAISSIGANSDEARELYERFLEGPIQVYVGHKLSEVILFEINYSNIAEVARVYDVDLGILMAIIMGESGGDPCYGIGTCRVTDGDPIITEIEGKYYTSGLGLFGIGRNKNENYSITYSNEEVAFKESCSTTLSNFVSVYDGGTTGEFTVGHKFKDIDMIKMKQNGEFEIYYSDGTKDNAGRLKLRLDFYDNYDAFQGGWVDKDGNLLYTLTDISLNSANQLILKYAYASNPTQGFVENLGVVKLISNEDNRCATTSKVSFTTLKTHEVFNLYNQISDEYLYYDAEYPVISLENMAQKADAENQTYVDMFADMVTAMQMFVERDGRLASDGQLALLYKAMELSNLYNSHDKDVIETIFVYYYGEQELRDVKVKAREKNYGNNWYSYYCDKNPNNFVLKVLSYYDASLAEENVLTVTDTFVEYVDGDKTGTKDVEKYYDNAYGANVQETKEYKNCVTTLTGKCVKTYRTTIDFTSTTGNSCNADAGSYTSGYNGVTIESVNELSSETKVRRKHSYQYTNLTEQECNDMYNHYSNQLSGKTNSLGTKENVCKSSNLKYNYTFNIVVDMSSLYESNTTGILWWKETTDNMDDLRSMCELNANDTYRNLTISQLAELKDDLSKLMELLNGSHFIGNEDEQKCVLSYNVTKNTPDDSLSSVTFKKYKENPSIPSELSFEQLVASYGDLPVFAEDGNVTINGAENIEIGTKSYKKVFPNLTISFYVDDINSENTISIYNNKLSSDSIHQIDSSTTKQCRATFTYKLEDVNSDVNSCVVSGSEIKAEFTYDNSNFKNGKYSCNVERTRKVDISNRWDVNINGFSIMAFTLFDNMSGYNEFTADKLARQNSGIEVYIKEHGNTRTDVDAIITSTFATEDNYIITADSYSLFAFFAQYDNYMDDSARSWFSPIGLDEDDVGKGTTNQFVKSKIWDFPILFKINQSPTGNSNITIVEQYGYEPDLTNGGQKYNNGITIKAKRGDAVLSMFDGTVVSKGYNAIYGNYVEIQATDSALVNKIISTIEGERYQITGVKALYGYLLSEELGGYKLNRTYVSKGTQIGTVGLSGRTTGNQVFVGLFVQCNKLDEHDQVIERINWTPVDIEPYFTTFSPSTFIVEYD